MKEKDLSGFINSEVRMARFQMNGYDFLKGSNGFTSADLYYPLGKGVDKDRGNYLTGWGCGIYAVYNTLITMGENITIEKTIEIAKANGAIEKEGIGYEGILNTLQFFDLEAKNFEIQSPKELLPFLKKGNLFIASVWEMSWDQVRDMSQQGDGHWVIFAAANEKGDALVLDSTFRPFESNGNTYGVYVLKESGYEKIAYDCDGKLNLQETIVLPGAFWYKKSGILVFPSRKGNY